MPEAIEYLTGTEICQKCKTENAIIHARVEKLCSNCYIRFIRGKLRKQMHDERYKVKFGRAIEQYGTQRILLALSGGESSLVLLDILGSLLQEQNELHKGKQGFELVVVNLDEYELSSLNNRIQDTIPGLLKTYQPVKIDLKVLSLDSYIDEDCLHRISLTPDFKALLKRINPTRVTLTEILQLCPNKSSAEDLLTVVYNDLILRVAAKENCQTVVYGHCMTRLANEIIALTVKGRGSIIHKSIADHIELVADREIKVMFPLREILQAEISAYVKLAELNKYVILSTIAKSKINKNLTIRDLTTNYFKQLDATGYASTASTVAKTGEKLGSPSNVLCQCQICGADIHQNPSNWLKRITVTDPAPIITSEEKEYYEMFQASLSLGKEDKTDGADPIDICFGCTVTLGGVKGDTGFVWPLHGSLELKYEYLNDDQERQKVLNEFVLTDDESETEV